jgi:nitrogen-specific signal transduction histidine kinase
MNEILIMGMHDAIKVVEALAKNGYTVNIQLYEKYDQTNDDWANFIDKNIYSISY